jgi:hypothetical protein
MGFCLKSRPLQVSTLYFKEAFIWDRQKVYVGIANIRVHLLEKKGVVGVSIQNQFQDGTLSDIIDRRMAKNMNIHIL